MKHIGAILLLCGFLLLLGAVGADDYAMESGADSPPITRTLALSALGLLAMAAAVAIFNANEPK